MTEPAIAAGSCPQEVIKACAALGVQPAALLDWALRRDSVTLVLPGGEKARLAIVGAWKLPARAKASQP